MVRAHHERPDGKGYPDGLQEAATPLGAYIIGVADSFDAMTTSRPYRRALAYDRAVAEIRSNLGTQYHRVVGAKFINIIQPELVKEAGILATKSLSEISQDIISTILK